MANPTKEHFEAFGALTYFYASAETGLKITLSGILDINLGLTLVLTEPYSALNLRKVIKSIAKLHTWRDGELDQLVALVGELKSHGPLRNNIAHSRWTDGMRPKSIKPRGIDIRSESARFLGDDDDEKDWTAEEIKHCANQLAALNVKILNFQFESGIRDRIERHIAATKSETE